MKWNNKGHEFDFLWDELISKNGNKQRGIWLFGAGEHGKRILEQYKDDWYIKGFIDNDIQKQGVIIEGYPVISLDEYIANNRVDYVVICVSEQYIDSLCIQMKDKGLLQRKDFCNYDYYQRMIKPLTYLYGENKLYLPIVQLSLTERCTLKCKKCAHGCAYAKNPRDMDLEYAIESLNCIFSVVDYVNEFYLIGGEPLLYQNLGKVIEYIGEKYRDRIKVLSITTNGTILPTEELIRLAKKYNIYFRISNYSNLLSRLNANYEKWEQALQENNINYIHEFEGAWWTDYGFDHLNRCFDRATIDKVFNECATPCREIRGTRFYYCISARSWRENANLYTEKDEYLDLSVLPKDRAKFILFEYDMGFSDKGYLDMCNYCYGADMVNHRIPSAEQI